MDYLLLPAKACLFCVHALTASCFISLQLHLLANTDHPQRLTTSLSCMTSAYDTGIPLLYLKQPVATHSNI